MARYGVVILSIVVIAALAVLAGACGTQGSGEEQSSYDATRQAGQRAI